MKKNLEIIVNNKEYLIIQIDYPTTIEQLKNLILQTLKLPQDSTYQIEVDGDVRDSSYQLPICPKFPILADFQFQATISFSNKYNQSFSHQLDLCKSVFEISKELAPLILPIEYPVFILSNDNGYKNKYLNSFNEIPKVIEYTIHTYVYVNQLGAHYQFRVNPYEKVANIKNQILSSFKIDSTFFLFFNDIKLDDQKQYINYLIPNHSKLQIIKQTNNITILVKYQDIIHQFQASQDEKLIIIKSKLRQFYKIPQNQIFQLCLTEPLDNDQETLSALNIQDNSLLYINLGRNFKLKLEDKNSEQTFEYQVNSLDLVSKLDNLNQFKNLYITYYFSGKQLNKNLSFEQIQANNDNITIKYQTPKNIIRVIFQDEQKRQFQIKVKVLDPIKLALQQIIKSTASTSVFYKDRQISFENTYYQEDIREGSIIDFKFNTIKVKFTVAPLSQIYTIEIQPNTNGSQLFHIISSNNQEVGANYKMMLNNSEFPPNQIVEQSEDQCFRIVPYFQVRFVFQSNNSNFKELFSNEETILNAKQKLSKKLQLPLNQLMLIHQNNELKDDILMLKYKDNNLLIIEAIKINFYNDGNFLESKSFNRNLQIKLIPKLINLAYCDQKLLLNNQEINESNTIKEITNLSEIDLVIEVQKEIDLISKRNKSQEYKVKFYSKDIVETIFSRFLKGNFLFYYFGQLINISMSFEFNQIQDRAQIFFENLYNFTLEILQDQSQIKFEVCDLNDKIIDVITPIIKEKQSSQSFSAYYNNRLIDLENSFLKEQIMDNGIIQIELNNFLTVIILDQDHKNTIKVPSNYNIKDLLQVLGGSQDKKLFSLSNLEQLDDQILLSILKNSDNLVELIYKEVYKQNEIYLPSELISNNIQQTQSIQTNATYLTIIIQNMVTDETLEEIVRQDQKIGDFIEDFEQRMEFSNTQLFYDGQVADRQKTFGEIGANTLNQFEII